MSRYRKVVTGEMELPEISGQKFVIYPTIEARMELLDHIKTSQMFEERDVKNDKGKVVDTIRVKGKFFDISSIAKTCAKIIYEGCWEHDPKGMRTKMKEEEKDMTERDILAIVLDADIMKVYITILKETGIISQEKAAEFEENINTAEKK